MTNFTRALDFIIVNSGSAVSETIVNRAFKGISFWIPTVDSCQLFLQGSWDQTSANFVRVMDADSLISELSVDIATGRRLVSLSMNLEGVPFFKAEMGVAQTDTRTIVALLRNFSDLG